MVLTLRGKGSEEQTLRFEADSVIVGSDDLCDVTVSDDGVGMPKDFDFNKADSLGLEITHLLSYQIGGIIKHIGSKGTEFAITFKEDI